MFSVLITEVEGGKMYNTALSRISHLQIPNTCEVMQKKN